MQLPSLAQDDLLEAVRLVRGEGRAVKQRADGRAVGFGDVVTEGLR